MHDINIIVARNPEREIDACWFLSPDEAYEHFRAWGKSYIYTAFNEAEGWSRPMNDEFKDWLDKDRASSRSDREASRADRQRDEILEGVRT